MTAQIPHAEPGKECPFNGRDVAEVCHKCPLWVHVRGANPQGGEVDYWNCAVAWTPMLLIENSQQQRQTAAAVEGLRNMVQKGNRNMMQMLTAAAAKQIQKFTRKD